MACAMTALSNRSSACSSSAWNVPQDRNHIMTSTCHVHVCFKCYLSIVLKFQTEDMRRDSHAKRLGLGPRFDPCRP